MPDTWTKSLLAYRYPVDLRKFEDAGKYPGWFTFNSQVGDRESTMEFEARFRRHASEAIEPWLEVVYWKIYSQPTPRGDKATGRMAAHFRDHAITPQFLWDACNRYIANPTRRHFESRAKAFDAMIEGLENDDQDNFEKGVSLFEEASKTGNEAETAMLKIRAKCIDQ